MYNQTQIKLKDKNMGMLITERDISTHLKEICLFVII